MVGRTAGRSVNTSVGRCVGGFRDKRTVDGGVGKVQDKTVGSLICSTNQCIFNPIIGLVVSTSSRPIECVRQPMGLFIISLEVQPQNSIRWMDMVDGV